MLLTAVVHQGTPASVCVGLLEGDTAEVLTWTTG